MNINFKKYFNFYNVALSLTFLFFSFFASDSIELSYEYFIGTFLFGPYGWPFVFYHGGSLLPFLGSGEVYFSLIKLLSDFGIFYAIIIISCFIVGKIKKESKIIIFMISIVVVIVLAVALEYKDSYNKKSLNLQACDLNNDSVCDNSDLEKFKTLYQESKNSSSYNQTIDFDKDDRVEKSDWFMLNFLIGNLNQWPPAQEVFKTQEECELIAGIECNFQICDFIPQGKTFEETCGKDFKKGWIPKNPVLDQTPSENQKIIGKIIFSDIEGGCWGFQSDSGEYFLIGGDKSEEIKKFPDILSKKVEIQGKIEKDMIHFCPIGEGLFSLESYRIIKDSKLDLYKGCGTNSDCKLIYDSCDCEAVNINIKNTRLPSSRYVCMVNNCATYKTTAVCENNQCVKKK